MNRIFGYDSQFSKIILRIFDLIFLNLIFIVMSLPIFTIGANISAIYSVIFKIRSKDKISVFKDFFFAFKKNFIQSTICWGGLLVFVCLFSLDIQIISNYASGVIMNLFEVFLYALGILAYGIYLYVFPMVSYFNVPTVKLFKNSLYFFVRFIIQSVKLFFVLIIPVVIVIYLFPGELLAYLLLFIVIGPSITAYVRSNIYLKVFNKYLSEKQ